MRSTLYRSTALAALALALTISVAPLPARGADPFAPASIQVNFAPVPMPAPAPKVEQNATQSRPAPAVSAEVTEPQVMESATQPMAATAEPVRLVPADTPAATPAEPTPSEPASAATAVTAPKTAPAEAPAAAEAAPVTEPAPAPIAEDKAAAVAPTTEPAPVAEPAPAPITENKAAAVAPTAEPAPAAVTPAAPAANDKVALAPAPAPVSAPAAIEKEKPAAPAAAPTPRRAPGARTVQRQVPDAPVVEPTPAAAPAVREVRPEEFHPAAAPAAAAGMRAVNLDVNKSRIIRLARPARDVLVANPAVADIVLRSPDTAFVIARRVGETNVFFFDADGRQIDGLDLNVTFDSGAVNAVLRRMIPNEQIEVASANQSLVLSGSVASAQVSDNARQIARQFVADDTAIINLINIRDKNQVLLRVRVSEMSRQIVKELGITPGSPVASTFKIGGSTLALQGVPPNFTNTPVGLLGGVFPLGGGSTLTALLQALESNGLIKTLAEPNLTAVSGETASFLVGGQFPVPAPQPGSGGTTIITITYKDFGVRLIFTPIVLSGGLINLKIATEVSQLSNQGQIQLNGFSIPALSMRRAETTVELPSGGSIAIAGLLQNDIQNTLQGYPGLKDIPVLGTLFSSTEFQRRETDLVISVTPLLVKPVDPNLIALPTDGFGPASDFNMYFLKKLHATYSRPTPDAPHGRPMGPFGYIVE
jgi:pilus assembly protein CpaC